MGKWTMASIGGGIVSVAAVITALQVLGYELPRPAWSTEVTQLAGELKDVKRMTLSQAVESTELRLLQITAEIEKYRASGQQPPDWLQQQAEILRRRIGSYQRQIDALP